MAHPRVLILTGGSGGGHNSVAFAIGEELCRRGIPHDQMDILERGSPMLKLTAKTAYEYLVRHDARLWGKIYFASERSRLCESMYSRIEDLMSDRIAYQILDCEPDIVICTNPIALARLSRPSLRRRIGILAVVVTDLYPHRTWFRASPDIVLVPHLWTLELLGGKSSLNRSFAKATGIPVASAFTREEERLLARRRQGLEDDVPTVTIGSGEIGGGPMFDLVTAIAQAELPLQLIVLCGRNERVFARMNAYRRRLEKRGNSPRFLVKPFLPREEVASVLRASDLYIGKAGGASIYEAFASACPQIIYEPLLIPGQEWANAEFLVDQGAGIKAPDSDGLLRRLDRGIDMEALRQRASQLARPDAARDVVDEALSAYRTICLAA